MRAILGTLTGLGLLLGAANQASARNPWYWNPQYDADHADFHGELDHRDFHRELDHQQAHRYPMTWGQHERLHDELSHEAFHDQLEHRAYHGDYQPRPYGPGGVGVRGRHASFWFGF